MQQSACDVRPLVEGPFGGNDIEVSVEDRFDPGRHFRDIVGG